MRVYFGNFSSTPKSPLIKTRYEISIEIELANSLIIKLLLKRRYLMGLYPIK